MDPLQPLIDTLHNEGRLRVWSLVITVFGDSVQRRGGVISNTRLQMLLGRVGVERGTLRTALSRLAKDGWLESERSGRSSCYRLSQSGMVKFADATGRIYAPVSDGPVTEWSLSVGRGLSGIEIAPNVVLCPAGQEAASAPDIRLRGTLDILSPQMRDSLLGDEHRAALSNLQRDIVVLGGLSLDPLASAAARTLLIHRWRRLVLRFPELPVELLPAPFNAASLRAQVRDAYRALTPLAEQWLSGATDDLRPMPAPEATRRF